MKKVFFLSVLYCASFAFIIANELNLEKCEVLFTSLFGKDFDKAVASRETIDDEALALNLIKNSNALESEPGLQNYIKWKAATLLINNSKHRGLVRDLLVEIRPSFPAYKQKGILLDLCQLQKVIVTSTSRTDKNAYSSEIVQYVSLNQELSSLYLQESDFNEAAKVLRDAQTYLRYVDRDGANELYQVIVKIQKEGRRYTQIGTLIKSLENSPAQENARKEIIDYFLFERGNFYLAYPYFEYLNDELYGKFFLLFNQCWSDSLPTTEDGLHQNILPLLRYHPQYFLKMLGGKKVDDPDQILKKQTELLVKENTVDEALIKKWLNKHIETKGETLKVEFSTYLKLAETFEGFIEHIQGQRVFTDEEKKVLVEKMINNKYIAINKANLNLANAEAYTQVEKLKLEMELGKIKTRMEALGLNTFDVQLTTPFILSSDNLMLDKIEISAAGIYTFDGNNYQQFLKDFDLTVNNKDPEEMRRDPFSNQGGALALLKDRRYFFKSKQKKWTNNIEVSFDLLKDYDPTKQNLDIYIYLSEGPHQYKQFYAVYCHFFINGGWFGVSREGEGFEDFARNKLTARVNPDAKDNGLWVKNSVRISAVLKDGVILLLINGAEVTRMPVKEIKDEKGFPNGVPIELSINRRGSRSGYIPIKIDNLYIGPPKAIK